MQPAIAEDKLAALTACQGLPPPEIIKKIENYEIIAFNIATINASLSFSGKDLSYTVQADPTNKKNKVAVGSKTGLINIKAEAEDQFDVKVTAKNKCGSATAVFNVKIDEDK